MRLAIAVSGEEVARHFGHCDFFQVFNIENKKVISEEKIINPPHQKGLLPNFLKENNINAVITGNLGSLAVTNLENLGIIPIRGVKGKISKVIKAFIDESLVSTDEICEEHEHHNH
jgi:predicted Fe-Mo cluster-binding NifX family protein